MRIKSPMKKKLIRLTFLLAGLLPALSPGLSAQAQTSEALINTLLKKGILSEQEAKEIKAEAEKSAKPLERSPFVLPLGKASKLVLGGFLQANGEMGDVSAFEGRLTEGPNAVNNRFRFRRARLNVSGEFLEHFDFKLEGDFQQGDGLAGSRSAFSATDVFLNWHAFPEANLKFGQYKAPYGLDQITSDTTLFTAERTLVTGALTPERQVGVQIWGKPLSNLWPEKKDLLNYSFGMFNGNGRNVIVNDNNTFLYVGRMELVPYSGKWHGQDTKWKLGLDGYYSRDAKDVNLGISRWQPDGSILPFSTHSPDERIAWGVDQSFTLGPFDLIAEYLEETVRPTTAAPTFAEFVANGYYVQGSYFFCNRKLQLVSKWESFNPGQAAHDDIRSITGGLNYYIKGDSLKLMLNYIHTWSEFRRYNPGLGQDEFDQALVRMQVMF